MGSYGAYYGGGHQRSSLDAYRASPVLHRSGGGGGRGGGGGSGSGPATRSYGFGPTRAMAEPQYSPQLYGFEHAEGLPAFEGAVAGATVAAGGLLAAASSLPAAEARYLAQLCHEALADFREQHAWDPEVAPAVETALRAMAMQATPSQRELTMRLQAMGRLKELAQSGIHFCVGLDLEPYGSFVSGLYTRHGDLDLSIEGQATWRDEAGQVQRVTVDGMEREMKVKFLRALSNRIQAKRLCLGQVDRILHARVPILKFRDLSGLDFDVGIGGSHALFKSTILGLLAQFDWRFGALVRLVKLWARHHDVNDSTNGTLNSFALTLLVIFHLQTRSPAVLPPLCELFGAGPGDERPMQEQRFPDWRLLQVACDRLSHMSRLGGPGGAAGGGRGNSETLLELLASFFSLYEGLLTGGWAASKGADALALRGVLRRVRVDTWAGRLRYERWDRDDYCMSIEDPFDSTDNCARTVRKEDKVARICSAVRAGRVLLVDLQTGGRAQHALEALFGRGGLHPRQLMDLLQDSNAPAIQWIRPVDLIIPPRIQAHTNGRIPRTVHVDHQRPRGGGSAAATQQQVSQLTQQLQQIELYSFEQVPPHQQYAAPPPPPPDIGLPPGAPVPGAQPAAHAQAQQAQQPPLVSLQELRALIDATVSEEAARLAEIERAAAEAAAAVKEARQERRAAKKATQKAQQEAKRAERQRLRAERGRSRSRSKTRSRSSSKRSSRSRSTSLAAAHAGVAAAVGNLGSASSLATTVTESAVPSSSCAVEPAVAGSAAAVEVSELEVAVLAAAAADGGSSASHTIPVASVPGPLAAVLAAEAAAASDGDSVSSGTGRKKEKRFGMNMKTAAKERKQRRAFSAAAGEAAGGAANGAGAAATLPPPPPGLAPAAAQQQQQQPMEQQPAGPKQGKQQRQRHRTRGGGRGGGRSGSRPEGEAGGPARVLTVPRAGSSGGPAPVTQA